ncbi:hypothetical protein CIB95_08135 [Lottiidibacillus patelloidae]|uniref:Kinase n=1 Tax=Lottiidibacillus patelloidae TaxID=2670334 RepID=A0A263BUL9_9BACI|nr:sporulation phosphorelay system protein KapB [Lottiidibacillus patelloidae]OZM57419.1 hypothetical protein CIB95_08135 [Lottiidibacillus patelloidae]
MTDIQIGDIASAKYKTGRYIGEVIDIEENRILLKILAILKHPTQGDLHAPKQTEVPLFHTRKALAHYEKAWMPKATVTKYTEEIIPPYKESLSKAVQELEAELNKMDSTFARESLNCIKELKEDYHLS